MGQGQKKGDKDSIRYTDALGTSEGGGGVLGNRTTKTPSRRKFKRGFWECCRKCIVRRVGASYKASGPDASGAYDASYSVVQGVVQHQHRTTQYDIVRPPSPSRRVNDGSGPSWGKGAEILALRVYNMPTVSTISRPRLPVVHSVYRPQTALPLCRVLLNRRGGAECCLREGGGGQSVA